MILKNTMKTFFFFFLATLIVLQINAQTPQIDPDALGYFNDALRFSQTSLSGTARFQALGGAQTALGADMSSFTGNPAGLGMYRKSAIDFSPAFTIGLTNTDFQGEETRDTKFNANVSNIGMVVTLKKPKHQSGFWKGGVVGLSLTRTADYHNKIAYTGVNTQNSLTDFYVERSDGIPSSELDAEEGGIVSTPALAYFTYLVNPFIDDPENRYFSTVNGATVRQEEVITTSGSQNQFTFAFAGNFADRFYFGATLGLVTTNYRIEKTYKERIIDEGDSILQNFTLEDKLQVNGTGINASFGVLWRILGFWRMGASITSPTYLAQQESFNTKIEAFFNNYDIGNGYILSYESEEMLPGEYNYALLTPFKAAIGTSIFIGKWGFVTVDAEYIDYSLMNLSGDESFVFNGDNRTISQIYKPVWNMRAGVEVRLNQWHLRGGYALYPDPFRDEVDNFDRTVQHITGGFGFGRESYYIDFALRNTTFRSLYTPYTLSNGQEPVARSFTNFWQAMFSFGFFF